MLLFTKLSETMWGATEPLTEGHEGLENPRTRWLLMALGSDRWLASKRLDHDGGVCWETLTLLGEHESRDAAAKACGGTCLVSRSQARRLAMAQGKPLPGFM